MRVKEDLAEAKVTRAIRPSKLKSRLERLPGELLASSFTLLNSVLVALSSVPDEETTIFRDSNEVLSLALGGVLLVNLDSIRNELNISNKVLMRLRDLTKSDVLALNSSLLGLVCLFIRHLSDLYLSASSHYSVLSRPQVPDNNLSIHTPTDDDVVVVGVEFNSCYFNRRFQNIVKHDDMAVLEVHDQHVSA